MEQLLIEYLVNALWQIPLLALGGWLLQRALKGTPTAQHALWLAVLVWAVLLPALHLGGTSSLLRMQTAARQAVLPAQTAAIEDASGTTPSMDFTDAGVDAAISPAAYPDSAAPASGSAPAPTPVPTPAPHQRWRTARLPRFTLTPWMAHAITGGFVLCILIGLARILLALRGNQLLLRGSAAAQLEDVSAETFARHCRSIGCPHPILRTSPEIVSPLTLSHGEPVIVLPEEFAGYTDDQLEAALCHELAHIERRDYLVNLLCQFAAAPIAWHPVTHLVEQRIGQTREILCDRMASRMMSSELRYAHSLFTLAQNMFSATETNLHAQALFNNNPLEERIMHLTEAKPSTQLRSRILRAALGVAILSVTVCLSSVMHLTPVLAQTEPAAENPAAALTLKVLSGMQQDAAGSTAPEQIHVTVAQNAPQSAPQPDPAPRPFAAPQPPLAPIPSAGAIAPLPSMSPLAPLPALPSLPAMAPLAPLPDLAPLAFPMQLEIVTNAADDPKLSPEDRRKLKRQLGELQKELSKAKGWNSEEFRRSMAELQRNIAQMNLERNAQFKKQLAELNLQLNSDLIQKQAEEARQRAEQFAQRREQFAADQAKLHQKMEELKKQLSSQEFQRQIEQARHAAVNREELQKQLKEMQKHLATDDIQRAMKEAQKELEQAQREIKDSLRNLPAQPAEPPQPETTH
jgi:beta-lactamase regulating signal transducer with metallopeptidase domain